MANVQKKQQVDKFIESVQDNTNFTIFEFEQLSHQKLEELRNTLRDLNSRVKVIKNSILEKAIQRLGTQNESYRTLGNKSFPIKNKTAVMIFGNDWSAALSKFKEFTKAAENVTFKAGYLDSTAYDATQMKRIADLPPREVLIGKVIGGMKSPSHSLVHGLTYNMQKMVYILHERSKQSS